MLERTWAISVMMAMGLSYAAASASTEADMRHNQASVTIAITVGPIAEISFPQGTTVELRPAAESEALPAAPAVMSPDAGFTHLAELPFVVRGNAHAVVEAHGVRSTAGRKDPTADAGRYAMAITFDHASGRTASIGGSLALSDGFATPPVSARVHVAPRPVSGSLWIYAPPEVSGTSSRREWGVLVSVSAEH